MENRQQNKNMAWYLNNFFSLQNEERLNNRQYYQLMIGAFALVGMAALLGWLYSMRTF